VSCLRAALALLLALCAGCAQLPAIAPAPVELRLSCPRHPEVPAADYVGPYKGMENAIPLQEMAQDLHCADAFRAAHFPRGFVAIYGSSRIRERNAACDAQGANCDEALRAAHDALYAQVRGFAAEWTRRHGDRYPIMTGAGPGLMEAGNRGAREGGGASVGYTTYYDRGSSSDPLRPYGGDPRLAFNPHVTRGLIFSSVAIREQAMVKHSAAIVLAPGGTGTEWEIFQILETIKSRQLAPVPVYLLGDRQLFWRSFEQRVADLVARRTVGPTELAFLKFAANEQDLLRQLAADLGLR
jgi:predicted Rossmann-fold nucleotide-binding protein